MPSVGTAYVNIRVNTKGFENSLDKVLARMSTKMEAAGTKMGKDFERGLNKANLGKPFDDMATRADRASTKAAGSIDKVTDKLREATDAAGDLGTELNGVSGSARRASRSVGGIGRGGGGGMRRTASDGNFLSKTLDDIARTAPNARKTLGALYNSAAGLGTAMAGAAGALSAGAQAIFAVGANAAAAAPSLAIMANGLLSLAQTGGVVALAMSSVSSAIGAGLKTVAPAATSAGAAATGMGKATAAAARQVRDAKDALSDAYREAARAAADAARKVAEAEHTLAQAQIEAKAAQEALTQARIEGKEEMEDIAFAAEDAGLAEQRAALDLADAQQALAATAELAPDNRARVEAQLAFEEADLNMRQAVDRREDADKAQKESAKKGVEGTEAVTSAQQDLADAQQAAIDATNDLSDARRDEARVAEDNADRIAEAQQAVADAQKALGAAQKGSAGATTAAAKAVDAYQQALAQLGPEQREFVERIVGMHDGFVKFRNIVTAPLFKSLNDALDEVNQKGKDGKSIQDVLQKGLKGTATQLGNVTEHAADLAKNDAFQKSFGDAMKSNNRAIGNFGDSGVHLADAFVQIADAAGPLFVKFSRWVRTLTAGWAETTRTKNSTGELQDAIFRAGHRVEAFFGLAKELWRWLKLVGGAADKAANQFGAIDGQKKSGKGYIQTLTDNLKSFNDALEKPGKKKKMIEDFDQALKNLNATGAAFKNAIVDPLISMGQDPNVEKAMNTIAESDAFDRLAATAGDAVPELAEIVTNVADILATLSESGSIDAFLGTLETISGVMSTILDTLINWDVEVGGVNISGGKIFGIAGLMLGTFKAISLTWKGIKFFTAGTLGDLRKFGRAGQNVGTFFKNIGKPKEQRTAYKPLTKPADKTKATAEGEQVTAAYAEGIRAGMTQVEAAMEAVETLVRENFTEMSPRLTTQATEAGTQLMTGLSEGIRVGSEGAIIAADVAMKELIAAMKAALGEHSPSTLTTTAGRDLMVGLTIGIEEGLAPAEAAAVEAGTVVGESVGTSAKLAAQTSTAGLGSTIGSSVSGEVDKAVADPKVAGSVGKFGKVFAGAGKVMSGAMRGIGGAMNFMMGPWGLLIMILLPLLMPLLQKLNDKFKITDKIFAALKWSLDKLADAFTWLWDNAIKPLFEYVADNIGVVWDPLKVALDAVGDALGWLWDKFKDVFGWFQDNWPLLLGIITGPIGLAIVLVVKYRDQIWDAFKAVFNWLKDNWKLLLAIITGPIGIAVFLVTKYWKQILDFVKGVPAKITAFLSGMWDMIKDGLAIVWDAAKAIFGAILTYIKQEPARFKRALRNLWSMLSEGLRIVWDKVKEIWGRIVAWVKGRPDQFMRNLKLIWDILRSALSKAWDAVKAIWGRVTTWVKGRPKQFKSNLAAIWDVFKDKLGNAWDWVVRKWGNIKTAILKWPGEMTSALAGLWDGLKTGLGNVWNDVAGLLQDKVIGGINNILDKFGVKKITVEIPTIDVQKKAEGGFIRGPGGPKSDRIPVMASNGEFMMPAHASRKLGAKNLEYMRKYGTLPPELSTGGFLGGIVSGFKSVGSALAHGAETAAKWILGKAVDALSGNWLADAAAGAIKQSLDAIVKWVVDKEPVAVKGVAVSAQGWTYPLTARFGITQVPNAGHNPANAVDIGAPMYTGVRAAAKGTAYRHTAYGYGNYMTVSHEDGSSTLYAHLASYKVSSGAKVLAGQIIALSDSTGAHTSGPHLHFELNPSSNTISAMAARGVKLGSGGVVAPSAGGTLAVIAEAGQHERVTPLDSEGFTPAERRILESLENQFSGGGGGDTYNVHPSERMNEAQLADMVARRVAWKRRRGSGSR